MLRHASFFTLALVGSMACDREPEQPRGDVWQPCSADYRCSDDLLGCVEIFGSPELSVCVPECMSGDTCAAPPSNENGVPTTARCNATGMNVGRCVVDCTTADNCPAGMLCFYDDHTTPETGLGVCAWPPL